MKANQHIVTAIAKFNATASAAADRFNAWIDAWNESRKNMTPAQFIAAMLEQFDKTPLAVVAENAGEKRVAAAHAARRKVLHVQLLRDMPKIDPTVKWTSTNKKGRVSEFAKLGITPELLAAVSQQVSKTPGITPAQIAAVLSKLGVKA